MAGNAAAQSSLWDRPAPPERPLNQTADYQVDAAAAEGIWGAPSQSWMAAPASTATQQIGFVPISESVIRATLTESAGTMTAGSILHGRSSHSRQNTGLSQLGGQELIQTHGVMSEPNSAPPYTPAEPFTAAAEERVFSLFDHPSRQQLFANANDSTYQGEWHLAPLPDVAGSPTNGHVLDGLDAVSMQVTEQRERYKPVPLQQIRPYRNYTPEGITLCPAPDSRCPEIKALPDSATDPDRYYAHMDFMWLPSNVFHNPLYFCDPALERYGHSNGPLVQPAVSVGRFAVQLVGLPYQVALDPPCRRVYPLGFFRPGECAPKQTPNIPLNAKAAVAAGATYTGLIFAFP